MTMVVREGTGAPMCAEVPLRVLFAVLLLAA